MNRQAYKVPFGDETFSATSDESSTDIIIPNKANFYVTPEYIHIFENDSRLYFTDIDAPLDVYFDRLQWHPLSSVEMIYLLTHLPRISPIYVQREYFDKGFSLINGTLPTQAHILSEAQNKYINNRSKDYSTPSEWMINQKGIVEDDSDDPNMDVINETDAQIELAELLDKMEYEDGNTYPPQLVNSDSNPINSLSSGLWSNEVDEVNYSTHSTDDIILSETQISGKIIDESLVYTTETQSSSGIERVIDDSFEKPKKPIAYKNIRRSDYEYPDRFRSGPKPRGPMQCNKQTKKNWTKKFDKTPEERSALKIIQNEKRAEKKKMGKLWKGREALSKADKNAKLLSKAFHHMQLQKAGDLDGRVESAKIDFEYAMRPDPRDPNYENFYKERAYYADELKKLQEYKKKKEYQMNEVTVNKGLRSIMETWHSDDLFSFTHTSSLLDDVEKIEKFIKDNVTSDELVTTVINAVHREVEKTPTLLDKATKFLEQVITHVKPMALSVDSLNDIRLSAEWMKKEFSICLKEPIPMTDYLTMLKLDPLKEYDLRDDHAMRGDLVHKDPLLQYADFKYINRETTVPTTVEDTGIVSMELLFQLMSPSVAVLNATEEIVQAKMQHIASNIHSINLPKMALLSGRNIVNDTLVAAFSLFRAQRRISRALGFPIPPQ